MKLRQLLMNAAAACLLAFFLPGSAQAQLIEIISDYCDEVEQGAEEAADELNLAGIELENCYGEYIDCLTGIIDKDPVKCIGDYRRCINDGNQEVGQACNDFLREFRSDTRRAERRADRRDVEDEFAAWFFSDQSDDCLAPALGTSLVCAGLNE